jgi:hypothetical protein
LNLRAAQRVTKLRGTLSSTPTPKHKVCRPGEVYKRLVPRPLPRHLDRRKVWQDSAATPQRSSTHRTDSLSAVMGSKISRFLNAVVLLDKRNRLKTLNIHVCGLSIDTLWLRRTTCASRDNVGLTAATSPSCLKHRRISGCMP